MGLRKDQNKLSKDTRADEERAQDRAGADSKGQGASLGLGLGSPSGGDADQLMKLVSQVPTAIAKLQTEYNKFFGGAEKKPPRELREALDKMIEQIVRLRKHAVSQSAGFKVQSTISSYQTYKTSWDKQLLDIESGRRVRR